MKYSFQKPFKEIVMNDERNTKSTQREEDQNKNTNRTTNPHQPINPFKEPVRNVPETPEEEAKTEQQRKEALTERD